jgi:hypothetical protein
MLKSHNLLFLLAVAAATFATACGGSGSSNGAGSTSGTGSTGGSGSTANNVASLIVDAGPSSLIQSNEADEDLAFTTVTVCVPGTATCQAIDHVQVDTGSEGLRIVPSSEFSLSLPMQTAGGNAVSECTQFADNTFIWGPVAAADIQIAGEAAKNVPVQLASSSVPPTNCSPDQTGQIETVAQLGANAIIGVGVFRQDCGGGCAVSSTNGVYFSCTGATCNEIAEPVVSQVQNPVWMFATDNNGVILELPSIPSTGAATATGSLIFGIGTQSDNGAGSATALVPDPQTGNFAADFNGVVYNDVNGNGSGGTGGAAIIDSGSNGFFFLDSATLTNQFGVIIPDCPANGSAQGFYCPGGITTINNLTLLGETSSGTPVGSGRSVTFNVAPATSLFQTGGSAFNDVAGPSSNQFDFGLPFFFGQNIYFGIEGQSTPFGAGPVYAF